MEFTDIQCMYVWYCALRTLCSVEVERERERGKGQMKIDIGPAV